MGFNEWEQKNRLVVSSAILCIALLVAGLDYITMSAKLTEQNNLCNNHWQKQIKDYCGDFRILNYTAIGETAYQSLNQSINITI
jgi:hypothetical protein